MKKSCSACRIFVSVLIVMLLIPSLVEARETTLTVSVPNKHAVHVEITGDGEIEIDGITLSSSKTMYILRHSTPTVKVKGKSSAVKITITFNGRDVTQDFVNNIWTMPQIVSDCEIHVTFSRRSNNGGNPSNSLISASKTGDLGIALYAGLSFASATGTGVLLGKRKKF